ncbi:MAG: DUF302 domain-containing protein [Pseudomonadota bacterium]
MKTIRFVFSLLLVLALPTALAAGPGSGISYQDAKVQIARIKVQDSVSFDDAVESLKLRANQHNLKFVGVNAIYKEIESLTGQPAKRMEIFNFCDGLAANKMLATDPMMIAFMPCRIAILEDAQGKRWVISMMMDHAMVKKLPADARASAERVMAAMKDMMVAASSGDL